MRNFESDLKLLRAEVKPFEAKVRPLVALQSRVSCFVEPCFRLFRYGRDSAIGLSR